MNIIRKLTLIEAVRDSIWRRHADEIARDNDMSRDMLTEIGEDHYIDRYIDSKSISWLLNLISDVLDNG
jgi:hypothetical protein